MAKNDTVLVYDPETDSAIRIPASELASGYQCYKFANEYDEIWARPGDLPNGGRGPMWHPPFDGPVKALAMEPFEVLKPLGLIRSSAEEWEAGLRRELNAWREVHRWLRIARAFQAVVAGAGRDLDSEEMRDVYDVVVASAMNPPEKVPFITSPRTLPKERAVAIAKFMLSEAAWRYVSEDEVEALNKFGQERYDALRSTVPADVARYLEQPGELYDESDGVEPSGPVA
jgi:hypothetical protein